ncbi:MAG: CoB--CoM heterodisulfide reductase iron-sulfur subunit B family protein [Bacillota bacterium]
MKLSYYPGCSLESTAKEYNSSALAVSKALGIDLIEIKDWSCCGATSAHSVNQLLSYALPARNIDLAQKSGYDLAIPCAACYSRLKRTDHVLRNDPCKKKEIEDIVNFRYTGDIRVMSLLETYSTKLEPAEIAKKVKKPLTGLKVACYYGCLLVRPPEITCFDNPEYPMSMDRLMKAIGAEPVKWSYKTDCCGASQSMTSSQRVVKMVSRIIDMAEEAGAQAIVTACPLCQMNFESRREARQTIPAFFFTELIGLALGLKDNSEWLTKHIVDPMPLLRSLSLAM